jgi:hypothetical protein
MAQVRGENGRPVEDSEQIGVSDGVTLPHPEGILGEGAGKPVAASVERCQRDPAHRNGSTDPQGQAPQEVVPTHATRGPVNHRGLVWVNPDVPLSAAGPGSGAGDRQGLGAPGGWADPHPGSTSGLLPRRRGRHPHGGNDGPGRVATDHHQTATAGTVEQAGRIEHRQLLPMSPEWPQVSDTYPRHVPGTVRGATLEKTVPVATSAASALNGTGHPDHPPSPCYPP